MLPPIKVRKATLEDCDSVLEWRNDPVARELSRSKDVIASDNHRTWFLKAIESSSILILVGEVQGVRIGFVKFEYSCNRRHAEISICLKPSERGHGYGLQLLKMSVESYTADYQVELVATIACRNLASRKIFRSAGFLEISGCKDWVRMVHRPPNILFELVRPSDADILYELLSSRRYQISHESMPSKEEHAQFIQSSPYLQWFLVKENNSVVGSFYVKDDNSVGINLITPSKRLVGKIIEYVKNNIQIAEAVKSQIPRFFFINVAEANQELKQILNELGCSPVQTAYRIF